MSKFILIDQSIEGNGGHYLEYASNVLHAAEALGYETGLAVNKRFHAEAPWNTYPVYSYNIWGNHGKKRMVLKNIRGAFARMRNRFRVWKAKLSFSAFYELIRGIRNREYGVLLEIVRQMHPALLIIIMLLFVPMAVIYGVYYVISRLIRNIMQFRPVAGFLHTIRRAGASAAGIGRFFSPHGAAWRAVHRWKWEKNFEKCTRKVISHFQMGEGDLIFIPTLDLPDLKAIASNISKDPKAREISWHMIFRRNLFTGREPVYQVRSHQALKFRRVLMEFRQKTEAYHNTYFYTDTEKLTKQYNFLNVIDFHTLPIPINPKLQKNEFPRKQPPYHIVYLGDARREKGYQYLDQVVQELWDDYALTGKVRFDFQSNFSFDDFRSNYDIVYAKQNLRMRDRTIVSLREQALDSAAYCEFVMGGDIGLLFYDRENYYARSSGALIECICFGMPVIVPGASWLSAELAVRNYLHIERLKKKMLKRIHPSAEWMSIEAYEYARQKVKKENKKFQPPEVDGCLSFSTFENRAVSRWTVPENSQYVVLSYRIHPLVRQGSYVRARFSLYDQYGMLRDDFQSDDYDAENKIQVMFPLECRADCLEIELWSAFYDHPVTIYDVKVEFYHTPKAAEIPYGTYGLVYSREKDIHRLLCNLIRQFEHYREEAKRTAVRYNAYHTAEQLVKQLAKNGNQ